MSTLTLDWRAGERQLVLLGQLEYFCLAWNGTILLLESWSWWFSFQETKRWRLSHSLKTTCYPKNECRVIVVSTSKRTRDPVIILYQGSLGKDIVSIFWHVTRGCTFRLMILEWRWIILSSWLCGSLPRLLARVRVLDPSILVETNGAHLSKNDGMCYWLLCSTVLGK